MTASGSRLSIDYRNMMAEAIGADHGLTAADLNALGSKIAAEHERIWSEHAAGDQKWFDLPDNSALADDIVRFASEASNAYDDYLLIGIGGSSLGAIATIQALAHPHRNLLSKEKRGGPRFFVLDNPDPEKIAATLETVDLSKTLVNVVTKSGQTAETMANFLVALETLEAAVGKDRARSQVLATTDASSGLLRQLADEEGYRTFEVPQGVDGRQTVLSAVGLIPAALAGIDIHALLAGAAALRDRCKTPDVRENPAYLLAALNFLATTERGKSILVTMPYADALYGISDWFRQLWAESLGKRLSTTGEEVFAGQTPIKALGAIDQHSQIQLYTEGPNDKVISLIRTESYRHAVSISEPPASIEELAYLKQAELGQLLDREALATAWALTEAKRPNYTITVPAIDPGIVGELFFLYELQTVMAGALFDVNPFGQPGVEAGKNATYALMGRAGYETLRDELLAGSSQDSPYVLEP